MLDLNFLKILVCPETHQALELADEQLVKDLNARIEQGDLCNLGGAELKKTLESGLVREDGQILYPIIDGIPTLLSDEAIGLGSGNA